MERLNQVASELPENDLEEVVGFAEALKAKRGAVALTAPDKAIEIELMRALRSRCKADFTWRCEELHDRGLR